jgi:hypothetical protein
MERWLKMMMKQVAAAVDKGIEWIEKNQKILNSNLWSLTLIVKFY